MASIGLQKGSGKRSKVREKSGNFQMDISDNLYMTNVSVDPDQTASTEQLLRAV